MPTKITSHPFGELVWSHLKLKRGLSQNKLAMDINQDPAVVSRMCKGQALNGPQSRERVVQIIEWFHKQGALNSTEEANALLAAADKTRLNRERPEEARLLQALGAQPGDLQSTAISENGAANNGSVHGDGPSQTSAHELPEVTPSKESPDTNLPQQLTRFVGREKESEGIKQLLATTRLLTLVGAGGTGKTRLACEVAGELVEQFEDGVWLVELASLGDSTLVPQAVARVLGAHEEPGQPVTETLVGYLGGKDLLLVLDNCEHLVEACAHLAETLLKYCPHLRILATSRESLSIAGEAIFNLPPLKLPDPLRLPSMGRLKQYEAIQLFVDRVSAAQPDFTLSDENASAVAQICHRLDGIPLALELAAARIRLFTVEEIARHLDDRFQLLTGGSRTALPRQRTLRALIDWSYDLLDENERALLRRLAMFAGSWSFEAAQAVCAGNGLALYDIFEGLAQLVNKSLVIVEEKGGQSRYRLLDTIRHYAREKLEPGEEGAARKRYREWYLYLAEQSEAELKGPRQEVALRRLEAEHDNLRSVIDWALRQGDAETAAQLASSLWRFWYARGFLSEGRKWLERALAQRSSLSPAVLARTLCGAGALTADQGDYQPARALFENAVEIYKELNDRQGVAESLNSLGYVAADLGDNHLAQACFAESMDIYMERGDKHGIEVVLHNLGMLASNMGDDEQAERYYNESLALSRELGDKEGIAWALNNLGFGSLKQGKYEQARIFYWEALSLCQGLGNNMGIALCLEGLAGVLGALAEPERAARLYGATAALRERIGSLMEPSYRSTYEQLIANAHSELDNAVWAAAWAEGRAMTVEQACADALGEELVTALRDG